MTPYDPKCLDLANYFNEHSDGCRCSTCDELAQAIQDCVERTGDRADVLQAKDNTLTPAEAYQLAKQFGMAVK